MAWLLTLLGALCCTAFASAGEPPMLDAQSVVWRKSLSKDADWQCFVLVRNCTSDRMEVARSPSSYDIQVIVDEDHHVIEHHDLYELTYPEGFVTVAASKVILYELTLSKDSLPAGKSISLSVRLDTFEAGRRQQRSVSCAIRPTR